MSIVHDLPPCMPPYSVHAFTATSAVERLQSYGSVLWPQAAAGVPSLWQRPCSMHFSGPHLCRAMRALRTMLWWLCVKAATDSNHLVQGAQRLEAAAAHIACVGCRSAAAPSGACHPAQQKHMLSRMFRNTWSTCSDPPKGVQLCRAAHHWAVRGCAQTAAAGCRVPPACTTPRLRAAAVTRAVNCQELTWLPAWTRVCGVLPVLPAGRRVPSTVPRSSTEKLRLTTVPCS
mmetsp:Transcript_36079/g.80292  ORF Transcript_36079/g.80292 Transcript_36079/m.80292 type:complete len:231 (+) Transcript_36079:557-1249(+)